MSKVKRGVPLYERGTRTRVAGVEAAPGPGGEATGPRATWLVAAASLGGLVPRAGDRWRDGDGTWWAVVEAGPLAGGAYPCTCTRETE
ncbi:hypothetical protein R5W24_003892 [Gemmata sp. JC717]|uniref:Uncharacterized protein n=1 Tax=Gemmata algarum TaxID=2975278 RepID=A0ABU5ETW9_9BACT|nr:hypothetical protein [Gemmata algarum]MDY3554763.1 hypothetical protein [Gemmata algarum]MDY3558409.1 hypothetical protein [Gemmata algarum]